MASMTVKQARPLPYTSLAGRSFLKTSDLTPAELTRLVDLAIAQKQGRALVGKPLAGKTGVLVFFNPSLRTRLSMSIAIEQLGGHVQVLDVGSGVWNLEHRQGVVMNGDKTEHVREAIPVIASYADFIGVRCFPGLKDLSDDMQEPMLSAFATLSNKPVINLESSLHHPCQALADMMTVKEAFGGFKGKRVVLAWANHPKSLPMAVPNSFATAAAQCGLDLTIACPPEYVPPAPIMQSLHAQAALGGSRIDVTHDLKAAADGAQVIYAKSWGSPQFYGAPEREQELRKNLTHWCIDDEIMRRTRGGAFMHCLPVRRNVVVTDSVLDGASSIVLQQAENRLHAQKALLSVMFGGKR